MLCEEELKAKLKEKEKAMLRFNSGLYQHYNFDFIQN
jgi:hypothetical protein